MVDHRMTILEHLDELRRRIIISLAAVLLASLFAFWKVKAIVARLIFPPVTKLAFFSPAEAFIAYCKVAICAGFIIASPVVLWQVWSFVSSALAPRERKAILLFLPFSVALFFAGAVFAFYAVVPWALRFLIEFAGPDLAPVLSVSQYLSFVVMLILIFGAVFELPVAVLLLAKLGIVTPAFLSANRKYALVVIVIAAAVLTPTPDAFTQLLLAVPLYLLYEISIWLSYLVKRPSEQTEGARA